MDNFQTLVDLLIKDEVKGIINHERVIEIGNTPQLFIDHANFTARTVIIKGSTVSKMHFDHGIKVSLIQRIPDLLESPKAIYQSATHPESAIVITYEFKGASPIIIAMHKDKLIGRYTYNECASMYGKEGEDPEKKWLEQGLLLWSSKK